MNKAIWSAIAQDPRLTAENVTAQYTRFFFGAKAGPVWAQALASLETNWVGVPGQSNEVIPHTLAMVRSIVDTESGTKDWRAMMYLKRAVFDAYIQARYIWEVEVCEAEAWSALSTAGTVGSAAAIRGAMAALHRTNNTNATRTSLRAEILQLTVELNDTIGQEVLGNQDSSLNLKTMDSPLSDAGWLLNTLSTIDTLPTEPAKLDAIVALLNHTDPGPGGYYDYLGSIDPVQSPRLNPGEGYAADPSFYFTPSVVGPTAGSVE